MAPEADRATMQSLRNLDPTINEAAQRFVVISGLREIAEAQER